MPKIKVVKCHLQNTSGRPTASLLLLLLPLILLLTLISSLLLYSQVAKAISLIGTIQLNIHNNGWYNNAHSIAYDPVDSLLFVFVGDGATGIDDRTNTEYRDIILAGLPGSSFHNSVVYNSFNHNIYVLYCLHEITGSVVVPRSGCTDLAVGVISVGVGFHLYSIPLGHEDDTFGTYSNLAVDSDNGNVYFVGGSCNDSVCSHIHSSLIGIDGDPNSPTFNKKFLDRGLGDQDTRVGNDHCCPYFPPQQIVFNPFNHLIYLHDGKVIYTMNKFQNFKVQNPIILPPPPRFEPGGLTSMIVDPYGNIYVALETLNAYPFSNPPPEPGSQGLINCTGGFVYKIDIWNNRVSPGFEVGKCPGGIAYDPANRVIYVANRDPGSLGSPSTYADCNSGTVSVIDADFARQYGTITVGFCPDGIAYDPANHNVYVVNTGVGSGQTHPSTPSTISIISTYHPRPDISTSIKDIETRQDLPYDPEMGAQTVLYTHKVFDTVKIIRLPGLPPPTGNVTYYLVDDKNCGWGGDHPVPPHYKEEVHINPVDGSVPPGILYSSHGFDTYPVGYFAVYSGDLNYGRWVSGCEPLVWKVPPFPVSSLSTSIKDSSGNDVTGKIVPLGTTVSDTATITGPYGIPTGNITYILYDNDKCLSDPKIPSHDIIDSTKVDIVGGSIPPSDKITLNFSGSVGYKAYYSGDDNYLTSISKCEPLTIFTNYIGSDGLGPGEFSNYDKIHGSPRGTAIDSSGNIYATDTGGVRIEKFDNKGIIVKEWGASGNGDGNFTRPWAIAIDPSNNVYVTDTGSHRIDKFTSDGKFVTKWGTACNIQTSEGCNTNAPGAKALGDGQFDHPESIAVDPTGRFVYVADDNKRIQKFDSNGKFIMQWGKQGINRTFYADPQGIAVDSSGNVYVADTFNFRIQKFDSNGNNITKWPQSGQHGTLDGEFGLGGDNGGPHGITIDQQGNVYVADAGNNRVERFTPDGAFTGAWGSIGSKYGQFNNPTGIAVDRFGRVYVDDSGNHRIQTLAPH